MVITDTKSDLETYWITGTTALPAVVNGHRQYTPKGKEIQYHNVVYIFDEGTHHKVIDPAENYRDEGYNVRLELVSSQSEGKRDNMKNECVRILSETGLTNYDMTRVKSVKDLDDSVNWRSEIKFSAIKYTQNND